MTKFAILTYLLTYVISFVVGLESPTYSLLPYIVTQKIVPSSMGEGINSY